MADNHSITHFKNVLEAALLTNPQALSIEDMQRLFDVRVERATLRMLIDDLKTDWKDRSLELVQVASGWRFQARPDYQTYLARLNPDRQPRYSRAVMETLAIIAYKQPVTRGDIEDIRGVSVNQNVIRALTERGWVEIVGKREVPGRPALYATTRAFLDDLNLRSLDELPPMDALAQQELVI